MKLRAIIDMTEMSEKTFNRLSKLQYILDIEIVNHEQCIHLANTLYKIKQINRKDVNRICFRAMKELKISKRYVIAAKITFMLYSRSRYKKIQKGL